MSEALARDLGQLLDQVRDVTAERDTARNVAVALEQELAELSAAANALRADLIEMHAAEAIDLGAWPSAEALLDVLERAQR